MYIYIYMYIYVYMYISSVARAPRAPGNTTHPSPRLFPTNSSVFQYSYPVSYHSNPDILDARSRGAYRHQGPRGSQRLRGPVHRPAQRDCAAGALAPDQTAARDARLHGHNGRARARRALIARRQRRRQTQ